MLQWIAYFAFGFAALFGLLLGVSLLQTTKKKSLKVRKKIRTMRRLYGAVTVLFLVAGLVLQFMAMPRQQIKTFIDSGSPVEAYQSALKVTDAEKAYSYLPQQIYAVENDYYIATGKNNVYGHLAITEQVDGKENLVYKNGLSYQKVLKVAGGDGILAVLDTKNQLTVNGAFEYLQYERDDTTFKNKVFSRNCDQVDGSSNNLFYIAQGDLYSVGYNALGQLGDGTERNRTQSTKIMSNVATVSTSETHTLVVDVHGNLYGFGSNSYSEMGNRTTAQSITPIKLMTGVRQAEAGRNFSIVLTKNGVVYAAGRNHLGQLGTGDNRDYANYQQILEGVVKIAVRGNSCAALTATGSLYVWGDNAAGQLGVSGAFLTEPTLVATDVYDVAMGKSSMGVIKLNRDVYVTGTARLVQNLELFQAVYQFNATVPTAYTYRETVTMPTRPDGA